MCWPVKGGNKVTAISAAVMERITAVARGDKTAEILLTGGRYVNVFTRELLPGNIAIQDGLIAGIGTGYTRAGFVIDVEGGILLPGLIDAHLHIESTLLLPPELARTVLVHGTTAVIADPHEIANVLGERGLAYMFEAGENLPLDFFFTVPSCVPATHMESSGGAIDLARTKKYLNHPRVVGLGEMMNYPAIVGGRGEALGKVAAALSNGKTADGHAPGLTGKELQAYLSSGINSDHECLTAAEASEKVRAGMKVIIRQGSAAKNLVDLLPAALEAPSENFMLGSDDKEAAELISQGHMNHILRQAVELGCDPLAAVQMATLNPALHYSLRRRGALAAGYLADIAVVEDLSGFKVNLVIKGGKVTAREGRLTIKMQPREPGKEILNTIRLARPLAPADFNLRYASGPVPVIGLVPGQIITEKLFLEPCRRTDGSVKADPDRDLLKLAVVERHRATGRMGLALLKGLGLEEGALASSVAHDSHNIIAAGVEETALASAVNALSEIGGGFVVVAGSGRVQAVLPLPAAGLMSLDSAGKVAAGVKEVNAAARSLGAIPEQPFLSLSFLALPVIPHLKLTDLGLVDVDTFSLMDLKKE